MELGSSGAKQAGYVILSAIAMMIGLSLIPTIIGQVSPVIIDNAGQLEATISQFIPTGLALALLVIAFGVSVGIAVSSHQSAETKPVAIIIAVIVLVIGIGLIAPIDTARDGAVASVKGTTGAATCPSTPTANSSCSFGSHTFSTDVARFTTTPVPTISGGSGSGATIATVTVNTSGAITAFTIDDGGTGYAANDVLTLTQGGVSGTYTLTASDLASGEIQDVSSVTIAAADAARAQSVSAERNALVSAFSLTDTILAYTVVGYVLSLLTAAFGLANMGTGGVMSRQAVKRLGRA